MVFICETWVDVKSKWPVRYFSSHRKWSFSHKKHVSSHVKWKWLVKCYTSHVKSCFSNKLKLQSFITWNENVKCEMFLLTWEIMFFTCYRSHSCEKLKICLLSHLNESYQNCLTAPPILMSGGCGVTRFQMLFVHWTNTCDADTNNLRLSLPNSFPL